MKIARQLGQIDDISKVQLQAVSKGLNHEVKMPNMPMSTTFIVLNALKGHWGEKCGLFSDMPVQEKRNATNE